MEVKTNPFYELRDRLYASAAAGCSLIAEDFRLKRAVEGFKPMSEANKVFGKLYAMCSALLTSENKAADIADCIALADALAVTQGTFADSSETAPAEPIKDIRPAHLSLRTIEVFREKIRKSAYNEQEFDDDFTAALKDPRLFNSFLEIAGKNGIGPASLLVQLGAVNGEKFMKTLLDTLDLSDKNATGNQIRYVSYNTKDKFNDKYIELAENEEAPQGIRIAALEAMGYSADNEERLITLYKTSKGKIKNAALLALTKLNSPAAEAPLAKLIEKKKDSCIPFLEASDENTVMEYLRSENKDILANGLRQRDKDYPFRYGITSMLVHKKDAADIFEAIAESYEHGRSDLYGVYASVNLPLIIDLYDHDDKEYRQLIRNLYRKNPKLFFTSAFLLELIEDTEHAFGKMCTDHFAQDDDIFSVIQHIFTTADGFYRIRPDANFFENNYRNIKLFSSVTDDMLNFLTDTSVICNIADIKRIYPDGFVRKKVVENMKAHVALLNRLLQICPKNDTDRIKKAAEKFAWTMQRNYPCEGIVELLTNVSDKPMNGVVYNFFMLRMKYGAETIWGDSIKNYKISRDILKEDLKRLVDEFSSRYYPGTNSQLSVLKLILESLEK